MLAQTPSTDFVSVTEVFGDEVSQEQVQRLCDRYYWAGNYCRNKDVLEVACGAGMGLGYLKKIAASLEAGDIDPRLVAKANDYYQGSVDIETMDAEKLPCANDSKDVIILFEAIYYLPHPEEFVIECKRVLRNNGYLLIATANKDLDDFNPSPYSHHYFGVIELQKLLEKHGFNCIFFGHTNVSLISWRQKILRPIKKLAVSFNLIPKTMRAKKLLKRFVFGKLIKMPEEVKEGLVKHQRPENILNTKPNRDYKVILCAAQNNLSRQPI